MDSLRELAWATAPRCEALFLHGDTEQHTEAVAQPLVYLGADTFANGRFGSAPPV
jgi:hypothetical protein